MMYTIADIIKHVSVEDSDVVLLKHWFDINLDKCKKFEVCQHHDVCYIGFVWYNNGFELNTRFSSYVNNAAKTTHDQMNKIVDQMNRLLDVYKVASA